MSVKPSPGTTWVHKTDGRLVQVVEIHSGLGRERPRIIYALCGDFGKRYRRHGFSLANWHTHWRVASYEETETADSYMAAHPERDLEAERIDCMKVTRQQMNDAALVILTEDVYNGMVSARLGPTRIWDAAARHAFIYNLQSPRVEVLRAGLQALEKDGQL